MHLLTDILDCVNTGQLSVTYWTELALFLLAHLTGHYSHCYLLACTMPSSRKMRTTQDCQQLCWAHVSVRELMDTSEGIQRITTESIPETAGSTVCITTTAWILWENFYLSLPLPFSHTHTPTPFCNGPLNPQISFCLSSGAFWNKARLRFPFKRRLYCKSLATFFKTALCAYDIWRADLTVGNHLPGTMYSLACCTDKRQLLLSALYKGLLNKGASSIALLKTVWAIQTVRPHIVLPGNHSFLHAISQGTCARMHFHS